MRAVPPTAGIVCLEGPEKSLPPLARIDMRDELEDFKNGGILPYVLRGLLGE